MALSPKPNSEMTGFLRTIKENPFDDTPRLIFADWLEDRGDARGELIRIQCQPVKTSQSRIRSKLQKREREILQAYREEWVGPENPDLEIHFHRGLVRITLPPTHLSTKAIPQPLRNCFEQGWVETIRITRSGHNLIDRLGKWPLLKHITHLDLSRWPLKDEQLSKLEESKYLRDLIVLDFGYVHFSYQKLIELASSNRFPHLQYVPRDCDTRLGYLRTLFRQHPHLKCSDLSRETVMFKGQDPGIDFTPQSSIGLLNLSGNPLEVDQVESVGNSPFSKDLRALILNQCFKGDFAIQTLMRSSCLRQLQVLDVGRNQLGNDAAIAIANATKMENLFYLQLEYNAIEDEGVCALANAPQLSNLRMLDLGPNQVGDEGLIALAESPYLKQLELISLWNNQVTDPGVIAWANSPNASCLRELFIGNNLITDVGAKALANSPYLNNLRLLRLDNNSGDNQNRISPRIRKLLLDRFGDWIEVHSGDYTD